MPPAANVDEYIASFPSDVRPVLESVRAAIHAGMPGCSETIRYGMPAVMMAHRYGLHFAGWKKHIGMYPVPVLDGDLEPAVAPYRSSKDGLSFRYVDELPSELITRIAAAVAERGPS